LLPRVTVPSFDCPTAAAPAGFFVLGINGVAAIVNNALVRGEQTRQG
jgi:hypothetical protein